MQLRVQDTGHGMDAATMERIFEPFFTTRDVGEGTGLGLAVVHGIATSLDAILLVDSSPGVGTDFRVLFPASDERTPSQRREVSQ
jgi:signal transduction histidine kinase